jgi:hypothetical protein
MLIVSFRVDPLTPISTDRVQSGECGQRGDGGSRHVGGPVGVGVGPTRSSQDFANGWMIGLPSGSALDACDTSIPVFV